MKHLETKSKRSDYFFFSEKGDRKMSRACIKNMACLHGAVGIKKECPRNEFLNGVFSVSSFLNERPCWPPGLPCLLDYEQSCFRFVLLSKTLNNANECCNQLRLLSGVLTKGGNSEDPL